MLIDESEMISRNSVSKPMISGVSKQDLARRLELPDFEIYAAGLPANLCA